MFEAGTILNFIGMAVNGYNVYQTAKLRKEGRVTPEDSARLFSALRPLIVEIAFFKDIHTSYTNLKEGFVSFVDDFKKTTLTSLDRAMDETRGLWKKVQDGYEKTVEVDVIPEYEQRVDPPIIKVENLTITAEVSKAISIIEKHYPFVMTKIGELHDIFEGRRKDFKKAYETFEAQNGTLKDLVTAIVQLADIVLMNLIIILDYYYTEAVRDYEPSN